MNQRCLRVGCLCVSSCLLLIRKGGLGGGDAGGGHAVGGAGDVGEANLVAELDGGGVAAVFAADAHLHAGAGGAAEFFGHLHELADAVLVDAGEDVGLDDFEVAVVRQEGAGVVAFITALMTKTRARARTPVKI